MSNFLYYGDNLDILRRYIPSASVDLVYLDPPFNSNQIKAFTDTWRWDSEAARLYMETVETGGRVAEALQSFRTLLGSSDILACPLMMAPPTGRLPAYTG